MIKKIGILTYFGDLNSGTNLQAFALQKIIQDKVGIKASVEIINYHAWNRLLEWHPYLTSISLKGLMNDMERLTKYYYFINKCLHISPKKIVSRNPLPVWDYIRSKSYDAIYIGSDTLLELDRYKPDEYSAFWLPSDINTKKFFVAASSKNLEFSKLSNFQKNFISDTINSMNLMGVRDDATYRLIKNFIDDKDKRLEIIPDPTFSYDIDYKHVDRYIANKNIDLSKPTICLHLTRHTTYKNELAQKLKRKGFQIASLRPAYYADILLNNLSPLELIGIFKYFTAVVTNRFHDSIFCFKNQTPMVTFPPSFNYTNIFGESKYTSLFKIFKLDKTNLINTAAENTADNIINKLDKTIENFPRAFVKEKLRELKHIFEQYIDRTIAYY